GIFRFNVNCSQVNCNGEGLFYSRRIGRAPQLDYGEPGSPTATTIYGAAKLTGRLPGGQTVGVLDAVTEGAASPLGESMQPRTQRDPVHFYQRTGSFDSTRTSLSGNAEELLFGKVGGGITRFETSYLRRSQGFEANDLGFLLQADQQSWNTWFGLQALHPSSIYQQAFWNFNWWQYWTAAGTPVERAANTNGHVMLKNRWWVHGGVTLGQLGTTFCDRNCSRG